MLVFIILVLMGNMHTDVCLLPQFVTALFSFLARKAFLVTTAMPTSIESTLDFNAGK